MPGPVLEMEPVEPQSLKKLSFKSLKRALDLFSPVHGQIAPPDLESKKMRISSKLNFEYGGGSGSENQVPKRKENGAAQNQGQQAAGASNALALPGPEGSRNPPMEKSQNAFTVGLSLRPQGLETMLGYMEKALLLSLLLVHQKGIYLPWLFGKNSKQVATSCMASFMEELQVHKRAFGMGEIHCI